MFSVIPSTSSSCISPSLSLSVSPLILPRTATTTYVNERQCKTPTPKSFDLFRNPSSRFFSNNNSNNNNSSPLFRRSNSTELYKQQHHILDLTRKYNRLKVEYEQKIQSNQQTIDQLSEKLKQLSTDDMKK